MAVGVAGAPSTGGRHTVAWAVGLAIGLIALVWYLGRADSIGVSRAGEPWLFVTGRPFPASTAFLLTFIAFGIGPALAARPILGRRPLSLGLGAGNYQLALKLLALGIPVALLAAYIGTGSPAVTAVYPLGGRLGPDPAAFAVHAGAYLLYYLGFEYLFRGFLLLGLEQSVGAVEANLMQAALATAFHFGKPGMEMAAAFPASLLFGWLTLRTRSIWCALALHWTVGVSLDWFLVFG